jgi:hypothetical protein
VSGYWLGVLTLPALVGVLAGLYGLYRASGRLIDKGVVMWVRPAKHANMAAKFAGVVASTTRTLTIVRITNLISVTLTIGAVNGEKAERIRKVVLAELAPPRTIGLRRPAQKEGGTR